MADFKARRRSGLRPDFATLGGLILAVGGIMAGLLLDGGNVRDVSQITAAMIVFGGTLGAVLVTTPLPVLAGAARRLGTVFFYRGETIQETMEDILAYATLARKQGIVSLEQQANEIEDRFLKKALMLAIDGIEMSQIRSVMELEIGEMERHGEAEVKVFEAAGGYAPTIGIIGAVLGLIQVMKNLENIDEVGRGIAVAFVATVYGVGSANIFFLPAGNKLRARMRESIRLRELTLEGVLSIVEGLNPKLIRTKLNAYLQDQAAPQSPPASKRKAAAEPVSAEG